MNVLKLILFLIFFIQLEVVSSNPESNVLIYGDNVQIDSSINEYESVTAGVPIQGTVMITHQADNPIDPASFRLGDSPLNIKFIQATQPSSYNNLIISIYQFQLEGLKKGIHTLPSIKVKVGGKEYQAAPLTIEVAS